MTRFIIFKTLFSGTPVTLNVDNILSVQDYGTNHEAGSYIVTLKGESLYVQGNRKQVMEKIIHSHDDECLE